MVPARSGVKPWPDLTGRVCVVTGGNRGIGRATVEALAGAGATVALLSRFHANGVAAAAEIIAATGNPNVRAYPCDLSSFASVRQCAASLRADFPALHVLVNNAGTASRKRKLTEDGFELTFGVNHLGTFLLTNLLLDRLHRGAPSRIVIVSSEAHQGTRLDFEDLQNEIVYFGLRAYAQSKLCNIYHAHELHHRLHGTGIVVNSMHPGFIATAMVTDYLPLRFLGGPIARLFGQTPAQGADSIIWLAASVEAGYLSGKYIINRKLRSPSAISLDRVTAQRLWAMSELMTDSSAHLPVPTKVQAAVGEID